MRITPKKIQKIPWRYIKSDMGVSGILVWRLRWALFRMPCMRTTNELKCVNDPGHVSYIWKGYRGTRWEAADD